MIISPNDNMKRVVPTARDATGISYTMKEVSNSTIKTVEGILSSRRNRFHMRLSAALRSG